MTFQEGQVDIEYHYGKFNMSSHSTKYHFNEETRSVKFNDEKMNWAYSLNFSSDYSYVEKGLLVMKGEERFHIGKNKGF